MRRLGAARRVLLTAAAWSLLVLVVAAHATAAATRKPDVLDAVMDADQQAACGVSALTQSQRNALAMVIVSAYRMGQRQEYRVTSSYGSFVAGLVEFDGTRFIFDLDYIEMNRLKRAIPDLEWLPDTRLVLYPYQVTWIRK